MERTQISPELQRADRDQDANISSIFDLGSSDGSDVARDKDKYLAEAGWHEYLRKTRRDRDD